MLIKKGKKVLWENLNYENPDDVVRAVITTLLPYYVAELRIELRDIL